MRPIVCLLVTFIVITAVQTLHGQERVISREAMNYLLPPGERIQAAATLRDTTLVVWGSRASGRFGESMPQLVMQRVAANRLLGDPVVVTDSASRVSGMVSVMVVADRYLILWNDRSDAGPVLRMGRVTTAGSFDGDVENVAPFESLSGAPQAIGTPSNSQTLIWLDSTGVRWLTIDGTGRPTTSVERYPGTRFAIHRYSSLDDACIVTVDGFIALMLDRHGRVDARRGIPGVIEEPFLVLPDTSIARLSSGRVIHYHDPFSTAPDTSIDAGIPDTALVGTAALGRDTSGTFVVYYLVRTGVPKGIVGQTLYRLTVPGAGGGPEALDSVTQPSGPSIGAPDALNWRADRWLENTSALPGCDNGTLVRSTQTLRWINTRTGTVDQSVVFQYVVDDVGGWRRTIDTTALSCAAPEWFVAVQRVRFDTTSTVSTSVSSRVLSYPIGGVGVNVPQRAPAVFSEGRRAFVTWALERGETSFVLAELSRQLDTAFAIDTLTVPMLDQASGANGTVGYGLRADVPLALPNSSVVMSSHSRTDYYQAHNSQVGIYSYSRRVYRATSSGWIGPWATGYRGDGYNALEAFVGSFGYDPDDRRLVMSCRFRGMQTVSGVWFIDSINRIQKTYADPVGATGVLIPATGTDYLSIIDRDCDLVTDGGSTRLITFDTVPRGIRYHRLLGDRFLRSYPEAIDTTNWSLATYSVDGSIRDTGRTTIAASSFFLLQHPVDSSLVFLYVGSNGRIMMSVLDKHLKRRVSDSTLSSAASKARAVAGTFIGDTLIVVWEDARNGLADIYGQTIVFPALHDSLTVRLSEARSDGATRLSISPNVVATDQTVALVGVTLPFEVELVDVRGVLALRYRIDRGMPATLRTDDLPNGVYLVRVRSGIDTVFGRLILAR